MPPKKKFSKKQIIDSAFEIARTEGINGITIRKVADRLGSSIAPIYVNFKDVEELKHAVVMKIVEISQQMLIEHDTGNPFHDMGAASLRFAKEYSVLFRDFLLNQNDYMDEYNQEIGIDLIRQMKNDADLEGFTDEELMTILLKMRIFTVGLSVMAANRMLPSEFSGEMEIELLDSTAADIITGARLRKNGD
ncbi:TetR/AcrR family transcriptional regulator [Siminovitchia sp. 179-K 8D1 HS]|uniref:TetR/AcrR family transcriptional regulator n=1 Tax=Siminovitchia sp. 179-K 8D1 HS TaxID=3142385 RepID=UPI0039A31F53